MFFSDLPPSTPDEPDFARPEEPEGSGRKAAVLAGAGAVGLAAVSVGAWAVYSFLAGGEQPAEALPAATIAYASVDLDPHGGQKIEAVRTLNRFPALRDELGLREGEDLRARFFEELDCEGVSYGDDIEPWFGTRFAVAAVDTGAETPSPVAAMNIVDEAAAAESLPKLAECGGGGADRGQGAFRVVDGWMLVAESDDVLDQVVALTEDGTLADSEHFREWTGHAGGDAVATFYAGPEAGTWLARSIGPLSVLGHPFGGLAGPPFTLEEYCSEDMMGAGMEAAECEELYADLTADLEAEFDGEDAPELPEELENQLEGFRGGAAALRFADGGVELEMAVDARTYGDIDFPATAGDQVAALPSSTLAALSIATPDGYLATYLRQLSEVHGLSEEEIREGIDALAGHTGLDVPDDIDTLIGDVLTLALDGDVTLEQVMHPTDPSEVPFGARINGDPEAIEAVLEKVRGADPAAEAFLGSQSGDGVVVVGPDAGYRSALLEEGGLGDVEAFRNAVPDADDAAALLFVHANTEFVDSLGGQAPAELVENLEPLQALGIVGWLEDGVGHTKVRLVTD